jgi:hypothetical protein
MTKPFIKYRSNMRDAKFASKPERGAAPAYSPWCQLTTFQFGKCFTILQCDSFYRFLATAVQLTAVLKPSMQNVIVSYT